MQVCTMNSLCTIYTRENRQQMCYVCGGSGIKSKYCNLTEAVVLDVSNRTLIRIRTRYEYEPVYSSSPYVVCWVYTHILVPLFLPFILAPAWLRCPFPVLLYPEHWPLQWALGRRPYSVHIPWYARCEGSVIQPNNRDTFTLDTVCTDRLRVWCLLHLFTFYFLFYFILFAKG